MAWDYARLYWGDRGGSVDFTCQDSWTNIPDASYMLVLADLGAVGWELVSVGWDLRVQGQANPYGGSTRSTSDQHMLFKRPLTTDSKEDRVLKRAELIQRIWGKEPDRARELAEMSVRDGVHAWQFREAIPRIEQNLEIERMHRPPGFRPGMTLAEVRERRSLSGQGMTLDEIEDYLRAKQARELRDRKDDL